MMTGTFSRNVGKSFSELKLVTDNLFISIVYPMYLFTNKPWKIVFDGYATLLVANRYNRTSVLMNFMLCAYNTTGHNIV